MHHRVFVYGTLLRGQVNHGLLARAQFGARFLGSHRTEPRFTLFLLGAYPGLVAGGSTAVLGEVYRVNDAGLRALDRLEDFPRLYDRTLVQTPYGRAWVYLYRGGVGDRPVIASGDWRALASTGLPLRAAAIRNRPDPKNPSRRRRISGSG
jgi:gamma-glutamylcyclotransferase (GGCT)/AIG2-like uncharacterized protein YtfP